MGNENSPEVLVGQRSRSIRMKLDLAWREHTRIYVFMRTARNRADSVRKSTQSNTACLLRVPGDRHSLPSRGEHLARRCSAILYKVRSQGAAVMPSTALSALETTLDQVLRGKPEAVRLSLVCLLAPGHLLVADVPGVGKTTLAHAMARCIDCSFHRLQFTSDMLPSDVIGVTIYNAHSEQFEFKPGPIFTNFLLADEINRTTPKTQSALLEAMNERQVTIDGRTMPLTEPFMVIATQNPAEHHGAYPLPESQLDRFLMRVRIGYPDAASEPLILRNSDDLQPPAVNQVLNRADLLELQERARSVTVEDSLLDYILAIVEKTRTNDSLA